MGQTITELRNLLWRGQNPFDGVEKPTKPDAAGFGPQHRFLTEFLPQLRPRIIVEVGVWKGASVLLMANRLRELGLDAVVIAVDTWLGSVENWMSDEWFAALKVERGYPHLFDTFAGNVVDAGLQDFVVPLPMDSVNARELVSRRGIVADMIHIDAGHDYASVMSDLNQWWQVLRPGGLFVGDDYHPAWPGVVKATNDFLSTHPHRGFRHEPGKCVAQKA